jgi:hypothetical protein
MDRIMAFAHIELLPKENEPDSAVAGRKKY